MAAAAIAKLDIYCKTERMTQHMAHGNSKDTNVSEYLQPSISIFQVPVPVAVALPGYWTAL